MLPLDEIDKKRIMNLDSYLAKHKTDEPYVLFRRLKYNFAEEVAQKQIGDIIVSKGYNSAASSFNVNEQLRSNCSTYRMPTRART